ncbi:hypothetical protein LTR04_001207 [Oleoguttula sp. CCFEE 6159]|nr:hypothetical protein LTR04_001207 [Oleoguttula sp. CCFEE 6159]
MPICIECRYPVTQLYTTYSKADDRSLGKGVRLMQCPRCKRFTDKYVEHDFVVLFIDLVLIKPQVSLKFRLSGTDRSRGRIWGGVSLDTLRDVLANARAQVYRHLLFNRLGRDDDKLDPSILRLGVLLLLFDVYLTWARIEKATAPSSWPPPLPGMPSNGTQSWTNASAVSYGQDYPAPNLLATQPIFVQYLFFLALCTLETVAFHLPIRLLTSLPRLPVLSTVIPRYPRPSLISTALLVSSFTKLFPLLLLIWNYDLPSSASAVSWAVIINNVAALEILLDCGYLRAFVLAGIGAICRAGVGWAILKAVGVGGGVAAAGVVETGDLIGLWKGMAEGLGVG